MQNDYFIDELLRLRERYPSLIWRLKETDTLEIEFYLEELAFDCAQALVQAGIPASHLSTLPRTVQVAQASFTHSPSYPQVIQVLEEFLQAQSSLLTRRNLKPRQEKEP